MARESLGGNPRSGLSLPMKYVLGCALVVGSFIAAHRIASGYYEVQKPFEKPRLIPDVNGDSIEEMVITYPNGTIDTLQSMYRAGMLRYYSEKKEQHLYMGQ